jgi:hypothetical protein
LCVGPHKFLGASAGEKSFVLADKLDFCRFTFLEQPPDINASLQWVQRFAGQDWPRAVRIEMAPLEPDPSRVQPITVVAPIHIMRRLEIPYADIL